MPVGSGPGPVAPISARQRKQVYLHSAIFDSRGVPPQSVYAQARQTTVLGQVQQQMGHQASPSDQVLSMPSASDLKATANQGHGVITWDSPAPQSARQIHASASSGSSAQFVRFGEAGEQLQVVRANKDNGSIQREFATLDWADLRCESMRLPNE